MKATLHIKFLRLIIPPVILVLFFTMGSGTSAYGVFAGFQGAEPAQSNDPIGLQVRTSTQERIAITLTAPALDELLLWMQSPGSPQASLGDVSLSTEAGMPQLPIYRALVGIPADAEYTLKILPGQTRQYKEPKIPVTVQTDMLSKSGAILPGESAKPVTAENYPSQAVRIVDDAWIRDQRVVVLEFYPLRLSHDYKEVRYYSNLVAELDFTYPGSAVPKQAADLSELIDPDIYDSVLNEMILNYDTAADWQASPDVTPIVDTFPIADGIPGMKIVVDHAGIYQVTYEDLESKGMDPSAIDPAYLRLQNIGSEIAYEFLGDGDSLFEAGESLRFYGEPLPALRLQAMYNEIMQPWISLCPACDLKELFENYSNENVYWLLVANTPGKHIQQVSGLPSNQYPVPEIFTDTRYAEEDLIWYSRHLTSSDAWFWYNAKLSTTTPITYTLPITLGVVAESGPTAMVKGEIYSVNNIPHHSTFYLNSALILDAYWQGNQRYVFTSTLPLSLLQDGQNLLGWQTSLVPGFFSENQYFDRFQIEYSHEFAALNDQLAFNYTIPGRWQYEVTGLASSDYAVVYDITDPLAPVGIQDVQVSPDIAGNKAAFEWAHETPVSMYLAGSGSIESPKSMTWYQPPELEPAVGADYIFISHSDFLPTVQVLADYRASQGLRTLVVDVSDVYDQFGYGIYHPIAIRNYLERAMLTWQGDKPEYVLLVGDGTFEIRQRDNIYVDEPITMPPALAITDPYQGEMDATNLLAAVVGTDIMPDLAIGRIPAKTADQVAEVVKKTINYEQASIDAWQQNIIYIADNTDAAGNFEAFLEELHTHYPPEGFTADKFYVSDCLENGTCAALPGAIIEAINTKGALFVNYAGHGSTSYWAASPTALNRDHIDLLTNQDRLPMILSWTCLDGFFFYPVRTDSYASSFTPSLVEKWLFSTDKGAVATFSSAGLGVGTGHDFLAAGFYASVFTNGNWNLGAASLFAKANLFRTGIFYDLINGYLVFGDPALQLASPYRLSATPAAQSGTDAPGKIIHYTITVNNTGALDDSYYLTASGNNWAVGVPALVGPVAAGSQANIIVSVLVPTTAEAGDQDQVTINVTSKGDRLQLGSVQITTSATDGPQSLLRVLVPVIFGP